MSDPRPAVPRLDVTAADMGTLAALGRVQMPAPPSPDPPARPGQQPPPDPGTSPNEGGQA